MTAAFAMLLAGAASAQDLKSYSYIEVQGGAQLTSTNAPMDKLITPTAALSFGHYFTPVVGARLHVNAWQSKSGFKALDQYYKWKYVTPDLDLMINLSNLFSKSTSHALNVILLGGVGLNYAWDNDELKDLNLAPELTPLAWDKNRLNHNLRAGLRLETNVTKPFGLSLEVNANSIDDRFNSKTNDADDWQFTAMLGLSFRFGHKYRKSEPAPVVRKVVEPEPEKVVEPAPVVEEKKQPEKKAVVKQETVKLHKVIHYAIRVSANETFNVIAPEVDKRGVLKYKVVGQVKVKKGTIWDNEALDMAEQADNAAAMQEETTIQGTQLTGAGVKAAQPGMFVKRVRAKKQK